MSTDHILLNILPLILLLVVIFSVVRSRSRRMSHVESAQADAATEAAQAGKFCTVCGKELTAGARFCGSCAAPVGHPPESAPDAQPSSSDVNPEYIAIGVGVLGLALVAWGFDQALQSWNTFGGDLMYPLQQHAFLLIVGAGTLLVALVMESRARANKRDRRG